MPSFQTNNLYSIYLRMFLKTFQCINQNRLIIHIYELLRNVLSHSIVRFSSSFLIMVHLSFIGVLLHCFCCPANQEVETVYFALALVEFVHPLAPAFPEVPDQSFGITGFVKLLCVLQFVVPASGIRKIAEDLLQFRFHRFHLPCFILMGSLLRLYEQIANGYNEYHDIHI